MIRVRIVVYFAGPMKMYNYYRLGFSRPAISD